jgi:nucleoside-diphosphate-sugar epimerase
MSGKRVLLTGGRGFIGRHCIAELQARGYEIHATTSRPPPVAAGVQWHRVNLLNADATAALLSSVRPDGLLHLAWYAKHGKFWRAPENLHWVRASIALLQAFIATGGRRAVFAGSGAEYDWSDGHCLENLTTLRPASLYGTAKHAFHLLAAAAAREAGISCAWGRLFFLYGPGEQPGRLVPLLVRSQLRDETVTCHGAELQRDYLYVGDAASALAALLDSPLEGAVNIGSGAAVPIRALAEHITARCGHPERVEFRTGDATRGEPPLVVANTARLTEELGWTPRVDLARGIDMTIDWWRQRPDDVRG